MQNDGIGMPFGNIALAHPHVSEYRRKMSQHGNKTHIGQFTVMAHASAALGSHKVATDKAELRLPVVAFQGMHEA